MTPMRPVVGPWGPRQKSTQSPWLVERQRLGALGGDVLDDLDLELLALALEELDRLVHGDLRAHEGQVLGDLLVGLGFDLLEVLGVKGFSRKKS